MLNKRLNIITLLLVLGLIVFVVLDKMKSKKTAYINTREVFNGFTLKKELAKKFENETNYTKQFLDSVGFKLQATAKILERNPNAPKEEIQNFLADKEEYLARLDMFGKEKSKLSTTYDEQILKQLNQYVQDYGKENGYAYIYGTDAGGNIMYASETENITKQVTEYINKKYDGK